MFRNISWKFGAFSIVCSRFIKGHLHRLFVSCRRLKNSRTKQAMTLKFWLRLVQMFKRIPWKFGAFSIVCSHFIKGHHHRFFRLCRHLNNSRTKQATALNFDWRLSECSKVFPTSLVLFQLLIQVLLKDTLSQVFSPWPS